MTKLFYVTVENTVFTIYCKSSKTRNGFKHEVEIYNGGYHCSSGKAYYLNRTWERWTFQSACLNAVQNELNRIYDDTKQCYKAAHNVKRITAKHKQAIDEIYNNMAGAWLDMKQQLTTKQF